MAAAPTWRLQPPAPLPDTKGKNHLPALTAIRLAAALLVVCFHFGGTPCRNFPAWFHNLIGNGEQAVTFFFVLSGFVIAFSYSDSSAPHAIRGTGGAFLAFRAFRIFPAHITALLILIPFSLTELLSFDPGTSFRLLLVTVLLHAWWPRAAMAWNYPSWSLSVEMFFYATFPWIVKQAAGNGLLLGGISLTGLVAGEWLRTLAVHQLPALGVPADVTTNFIKYFPLWHWCSFGFGVGLGLLFYKGYRVPAATAASILSVSVAGLLFCSSPFWPQWVFHTYVMVPLSGAVIWSLASEEGVLHSFFSHKWLLEGGEASYALYILHYPVQRWCWWLFGRFTGETFSYFAAYVVVLLITSVLTSRYCERPLQRRLRSWWYRGRVRHT